MSFAWLPVGAGCGVQVSGALHKPASGHEHAVSLVGTGRMAQTSTGTPQDDPSGVTDRSPAIEDLVVTHLSAIPYRVQPPASLHVTWPAASGKPAALGDLGPLVVTLGNRPAAGQGTQVPERRRREPLQPGLTASGPEAQVRAGTEPEG